MLLTIATGMLGFLPWLQTSQASDASASKGKNPIEFDRTGVRWAHSFQEALGRAKSEKRLLFLMPDNGAPTDNGALGLEVFRAGALCDERIRALIDLRFVPFYFNCFALTAAFDEQALAFVVAEKKEFGKEEQHFDYGIPVLVMTPQGKLVGEVGTYMPIDTVLEELQHALKKNAAFDAPSEAEKTAKEPLARARLLFARGELDAADGLLKKDKSVEALVLRAKIARLGRDWKTHKRLLAELQTAAPEDAAVERAHALLANKQYEEAAAELRKVEGTSERGDEARYLEGLARFGLKDEKGALEVWKTLIEGRPQGPWIYRADWAYENVMTGPATTSGTIMVNPGPLGREGYFGPRNPDLPPM